MYTKKEQNVLERYLPWCKIMYSENQDSVQKGIKDLVSELSTKHPDKQKLVFVFEDQNYVFDQKSEDLYLVNELEAEIIKRDDKNLQTILNELNNEYSADKIEEIYNNIYSNNESLTS